MLLKIRVGFVVFDLLFKQDFSFFITKLYLAEEKHIASTNRNKNIIFFYLLHKLLYLLPIPDELVRLMEKIGRRKVI
jgi:hypothetical protein